VCYRVHDHAAFRMAESLINKSLMTGLEPTVNQIYKSEGVDNKRHLVWVHLCQCIGLQFR